MSKIRALGTVAAGALGAATGYYIEGATAAIAIGLAAAAVAAPFRWTHPHRWRQLTDRKQLPTGWVSWYVAPRSGVICYLRHFPAGNICQEYYGEGYEYVEHIHQATVFENRADAEQVTPKYDGSAGIESRAGVKPVNRQPTRTHLQMCRTCSDGGDCGAHLTFPAEKPIIFRKKD